MTTIRFSMALLLVCALPLLAQERVDLTTPITKPSVTTYAVTALLLTWEPTPQIVIRLKGSDELPREFVYEGATATTMLIGLNKANLATRSLNHRILDRLVLDGKVAGSVVGTPQ